MPRAHRYYLPGHVWHITHRCHQQEFFLKFAKDRRRWIEWLFEAKQRFGLCVLNYVATSNHIHLLVRDCGNGEIARSMQLVAGRVAQEYNLRKQRKGAFWEDRYHATAVATDDHLLRCLLYIDFNMVRAGVVKHPGDWPEGGYAELQGERQRYQVTDREALLDLLGLRDHQELTLSRSLWVDEMCESMGASSGREACWTEGLAVGSVDFVRCVQGALGQKGSDRQIHHAAAGFVLKEADPEYQAGLPARTGF
jgi:putative transposase